ncbi:MAG: lactonase family protein [Lachnospiraceae bacterium]
MKNEKYVAYVGTYTHQNSVGIHIFDLDVAGGFMTERKVVPINNPSDLVISTSGKYLYSIADEGVEAFRIKEDGDLEPINKEWNGGMRGCDVSVDSKDRYLFVGGYHDGRVSMMHLNEDGSIGTVADGIFHKGLGVGVADRAMNPHVTCIKLTPDEKYLCAVDCGLDQVKIYRVDFERGKLKLADILRCDLDSAPRTIRFSEDGRFAYVLCEIKNSVEVYEYQTGEIAPEFKRIQSVSTLGPKEKTQDSAACAMEFSPDGNYLFCSNTGINTTMIYKVNQKDGTLSSYCHAPISGEYPKALAVYPDGKHFMTLNHETNQICTFVINTEGEYFLIHGKPLKIETPNSIQIHKLG